MARTFSWPYRVAKDIARIPALAITRRHWEGADNLPHEGGFIAAANHISEFDAITFMHFLVDNGIPVRMMAKKELFGVPGLGWLMTQAGQVPVDRSKGKGGGALDAAEEALRNGECLGIYPEGTVTRDSESWPMRGKTGAARLALRTRVPVVPVAQWGAQDVLGRYQRVPNLAGRKDVWVRAGAPIDLSDLYDRADDPAAWREATDRIMSEIISMVEDMRGATMTHEPIALDSPHALTKADVKKLEATRRSIDGTAPSRRKPFPSRH
ncbi:1-acyl-sn-glycerol-3-phosphate acyltransferase [Nanchangia anserum]|uniref:1-acyl-sn-glycerol-3-phosphate acyltransferase n=1 Tax=Nanchangia anserum TaxID=2692125 RepID=A0A8I0KN46_9ACTO|nr:lysophospholipid acyltransferase family protein [Nanchangia anserum]MBD3688896.1 1-acyl-sn-glycerol-3-phosphate acyltransferase [Nanchangia anserum]QOX81160.1 1-acyl-sn-glycerol-3-phosphate acyltransferase [Nanchangia anserum]